MAENLNGKNGDIEAEKYPQKEKFVTVKKRSSVIGGLGVAVDILIHMCAAIVSFMALAYCFDYESRVNQRWHIALCTCGYQLLMSEAILMKSEGCSWSEVLSGKQRRTVHWVMQILASGMVIAGTVIRINMSATHFFSLHGKFGLIAMVCTVVSCVNGLASLYALELRGICNGLISRLSHILFGSATLVFASVAVCYGFKKSGFTAWSSASIVNALVVLTSILTFLVVMRPAIAFVGKTKSAFSR